MALRSFSFSEETKKYIFDGDIYELQSLQWEPVGKKKQWASQELFSILKEIKYSTK